MILVNGEYTDFIPISDRGFQYGDGLFETIPVVDGHPVCLKYHLNRLVAGCIRLKILQPQVYELTEEIKQFCAPAKDAVLKIIISRGSGGRGYKSPENIQPTRVLSLHPFPEYPPEYTKTGVNARFCDTTLGLNPSLAGIKHLNRLEQVMARSEWDDPNVQEGIMLDINGGVIEGTMSNIFYVKEGIVNTASIKLSGVAGVTREIIKQLSDEHGLPISEHNYGKQELLTAEEAFFCNSIIGIWPIKEISGTDLSVGKITRQIQGWLTEFKARDIAHVS